MQQVGGGRLVILLQSDWCFCTTVFSMALACRYTMRYVPAPFSWTSHSLQIPELSHYQVCNYVQSYASYLNVNSNDENPATAYNTHVECIKKWINQVRQEQGWRLWLRSLQPTRHDMYRVTWWTEVYFSHLACPWWNIPSYQWMVK